MNPLIAVIDVETTGLFPNRHDRVVEIAVVVMELNGSIIREFSTLVNPERDIGPTRIHGLTSELILRAPRFAEVAGHILTTLDGTIALAAHNVRFDQRFLEAELLRSGLSFPDCHCLCTMELASGGKLRECCRIYGVECDGEAHDALNDARAAAALLAVLVSDQPALVKALTQRTAITWPQCNLSRAVSLTRAESRRRVDSPPNFLSRLLDRRSEQSELPDDGASMAYTALLDQVLEDRRIEDTEGDALVDLARSWGLDGPQIRQLHLCYLTELARTAYADGVITESEGRDLKLVGRLLGLDASETQNAVSAVCSHPAVSLSLAADLAVVTDLRGKRVCFTGDLLCRLKDKEITREIAEELATGAGLIVSNSVTKKLDLLVVADPNTQSGKAKKARQYGIRIMQESVFWKAIGIAVE